MEVTDEVADMVAHIVANMVSAILHILLLEYPCPSVGWSVTFLPHLTHTIV